MTPVQLLTKTYTTSMGTVSYGEKFLDASVAALRHGFVDAWRVGLEL